MDKWYVVKKSLSLTDATGKKVDYKVGEEIKLKEDESVKALVSSGSLEEKAQAADSEASAEIVSLVEKVAKKAADDAVRTALEEVHKGMAKEAKSRLPGFIGAIEVGDSPEDKINKSPWGTWKSAGHFIREVREKAQHGVWSENGRKYIEAITKVTASETGFAHTEAIGEDGGILVPPEMATTIFQKGFEENPLYQMADKYTVSGAGMVFPALTENSRAEGYRNGGAVGYWRGEGDDLTLTRSFRGETIEVKLYTFGVFCAATQELLEDTGNAAERWIVNNASKEVAFKTGLAIFSGNGVNKPFGFTNVTGGCCLEVTRTTALKIIAADVLSQCGRFWPGGWKNATWFVNFRAPWTDLISMYIAGTTSDFQVYLPPGRFTEQPYGVMFGRPVTPLEYCATVGTTTDIVLADMSQYCVITKADQRAKVDVSTHLLFDQMKTAFRLSFRIGGRPWWASAVTPYDAGATVSPFVRQSTKTS